MKAAIIKDEWWPVYSISEDEDDIWLYGEVEMDAQLLQEQKETIIGFNNLQEKLGEIYERTKAARPSGAQQRAERRS